MRRTRKAPCKRLCLRISSGVGLHLAGVASAAGVDAAVCCPAGVVKGTTEVDAAVCCPAACETIESCLEEVSGLGKVDKHQYLLQKLRNANSHINQETGTK